jgi:hypothetical protein
MGTCSAIRCSWNPSQQWTEVSDLLDHATAQYPHSSISCGLDAPNELAVIRSDNRALNGLLHSLWKWIPLLTADGDIRPHINCKFAMVATSSVAPPLALQIFYIPLILYAISQNPIRSNPTLSEIIWSGAGCCFSADWFGSRPPIQCTLSSRSEIRPVCDRIGKRRRRNLNRKVEPLIRSPAN